MDWVKIVHLLCVFGWMTSIFAVPRALIYWRRERAALGRSGPLADLTIRLYRFAAGLGVVAAATGLWLGASVWAMADWVWIKIGVVALLAGHYAYTGRLVWVARRGEFPHSDRWLRVFNEVSVVGVVAVLWVVVFKPT